MDDAKENGTRRRSVKNLQDLEECYLLPESIGVDLKDDSDEKRSGDESDVDLLNGTRSVDKNEVKKQESRKKKTKFTAYLLWFFFGWFGAHHFYLRRDRQAFLWFATLGGYFGCGWIRDLFCIPAYVRYANGQSKAETKQLKIKYPDKPPWDWYHFIGQMTIANMFSMLWLAAVPEELVFGWNLRALTHFFPMACALGVHTVGNIGKQRGDLYWPVIGAYGSYVIVLLFNWNTNWCSMAASSLFEKKAKRWSGREKPQHCCKRLGVLVLCGLLYVSLWMSYAYFNAEVTDKEGEKIKLRDAIGNFFRSPMWNDVVESLTQMYNYGQHHGWRKVWQDFIERLDPHGEQNALKFLGLTNKATQEEITARYRKLSREWHPDKQKDSEKKAEYQEKFIELQQSYERLSSLKNRRLKRNKEHQEL